MKHYKVVRTKFHAGPRYVNGRIHGSRWKDAVEVRLFFDDAEEAKQFLEDHNLEYGPWVMHKFDENDY